MAEEKPIVAEKPPEPETWDKSQKDIVAGAVAWMYQACIDQGHKWNTLHAADPIVADGHRLVLADAARRGIPGVDVDVTYTDLLAAMHAYGKEDVGKAREKRARDLAEAEKARKVEDTPVLSDVKPPFVAPVVRPIQPPLAPTPALMPTPPPVPHEPAEPVP